MKNKKEWKSLNRRGLAALLTLAMCLGTVPLTAFAAEDAHEHNQNGWYCEWIEPEQELNCQHEHDEDCYVPDEPVLECTEDHHGEDCYVPGEDVLTCENEDEDHEHDENCYASGEDVLACDEDHHTEDCYVPAEDVLDCRHEHAEDCFSAAEGFWSCTPPVEDTADEADEDVMNDDDQFVDDDDKQGVVDEDETFDDYDQTVVEDEDVFNDDNQQNDIEDEDEALIPDEVQAFLDAVAKIPEITPENAIEVAEYVYGEVSEYYEALLGTEYEDREDVQKAVAVYAAAVEAVDAALDMESDDFAVTAQPYREVFPNGVYGTEDGSAPVGRESGYSGDTFVFNTLPVWQSYMYTYYPDAYYYELKSTSDPNNIIDKIYYSVGKWTGSLGYGMPCFQVNIDTKEGAVGTARVKVLLVYYIDEVRGVAGQTGYFSRTMDCTISVSAKTYTVTYTDGVTGEEIFKDQTTRGLKFTDPIPEFNGSLEREGYTFKGWTPELMATIEDAVAADQAEEYYGYSEIVYTARWEEDDSAPEAPPYGQVASILGRKGFVKVICDSNPANPGNSEHHYKEEKIFSTIGGNENNYVMDIGEVEKREDGNYYCTLTLHGSAYADFYSYASYTGVKHTLKHTDAYPADQTITLKWNPNKPITNENLAYEHWEEANGKPQGTILATFLVVCKAPETLYSVFYTDGVPKEIVFPDQGYEGLKAEDPTPRFMVEGKEAEPTRAGYTFMGWTPAWKATVEPAMADEYGVITYTATWEKHSLSDFTKELVATANGLPDDIETDGITFPNDGKVSFGDKDSITLLYRITVTGTAGMEYSVADTDADWVGGAKLTGTIPEGGKAVIYVTRTFNKSEVNEDGELVNIATVTPGTGDKDTTDAEASTPVEDEQEYTLKYDANGGEGAPDEVKQKDAEFTISDTKPTRDGYVFAGWADEDDATEAKYQPGDKITLTEKEPDKTIYAVWAKISVTKTMKKTEGSVDDDKLRNGDTVLYTIAVKNAGNTPLNDLQFFDDMDSKLTKPEEITIDGGWNVTSTYYPADASNAKPLLHIRATGNTLEVGESVVVQYEAKIDGADGTKVINTVNVYAEIGKYVSAASRKMAAFRSDGPGGSAGSEGETVGSSNVDVDEGTGERPKPPTGGVSGGDSTGGKPGGDTEEPPVVEPKPALSVKKTADKETARVGETITYEVTVTNNGETDLIGVMVDDILGVMVDDILEGRKTLVGAMEELKAGESKTFKYTYIVAPEFAGKSITNNVSVYSKEFETPVTDSVTVQIKETVLVTIKYVDEKGEQIGAIYIDEIKMGAYDISDKIAVPDGYAIISIEGELTGTTDREVNITVTCGVDKRGNDNGNPTEEPDGIPDVFQPIVKYIVSGGTWQENDLTVKTVKEVVFNLVDEQGNELAPTLGDTIPTPVVNAETNTEEGAGWDGTVPTADTAVTENGATYTYVFPALDGMRTITVNRVHNGTMIDSISVTVPKGEDYTVTEEDAPAAFDNGGNHYIRIDALPTVSAEDEGIDVHYAIDNIGGGANGNSPDGIPDDQQAVVYYRSSNTAYGTVRDAYQMFDLRPDVDSREETLRNVASTRGSARFTNWTTGNQTLSTSAALENVFTVEAGHTYTVIANFSSNTGGGSSGGGGGGGGGGGSSSGNTSSNDNNTNNDTTTDDTVTINDTEVPLADITSLNREDHFAYVSGYTDGTVRPTNNITREEVAAIFYRLLTDVSRTVYETGVNNFSDVDSSRWSNNAISTLANAGIISGYKEGTFKPGQTITRAEFAAIASRFDTVSENVTNPFTDTEGHWAEQLISNAADKGWVGGYPDSTFQPSNAITRAEAMTLINKVLNREVDKEGLLADAKQWPDNEEGKWYYYQVLEATNSHDYERRSADSNVENWTAITQK